MVISKGNMAASSKINLRFSLRVEIAVRFSSFFYFLISEFRIALIQLAVSSNKAQNLLRAKDKIKEAVSNGAKIVALPVRASFNFRELVLYSANCTLVGKMNHFSFLKYQVMLSAEVLYSFSFSFDGMQEYATYRTPPPHPPSPSPSINRQFLLSVLFYR